MIIANSALRASLAIYHLISNARSWNKTLANCTGVSAALKQKKTIWLCCSFQTPSLLFTIVFVSIKSSRKRESAQRLSRKKGISQQLHIQSICELSQDYRATSWKHKIIKFTAKYLHLGNSTFTTFPKLSWRCPALFTLVELQGVIKYTNMVSWLR